MHGFPNPHEPNCLSWPGMTELCSPGTADLDNSTYPALPREMLLWGTWCSQSPAPPHQGAGEWTNQHLRNGASKGTGQGWLRKGGTSQMTKISILFPLQKMLILHTDSRICQCCWSILLKTLHFQSTSQMQHGSKALSILTYMPKVYLLCGGRDKSRCLNPLMTPKWPAWCDVMWCGHKV